MLTVDQQERWTATQLLAHPWMTLSDDKLEEYSLEATLTELRKFNTRRHMRGSIHDARSAGHGDGKHAMTERGIVALNAQNFQVEATALTAARKHEKATIHQGMRIRILRNSNPPSPHNPQQTHLHPEPRSMALLVL